MIAISGQVFTLVKMTRTSLQGFYVRWNASIKVRALNPSSMVQPPAVYSFTPKDQMRVREELLQRSKSNIDKDKPMVL
jgi:hypothetical protein